MIKLPKVHKAVIPLRPISPPSQLPHVGNTPHHIKNSTVLTNKVQKLSLNKDETTASSDLPFHVYTYNHSPCRWRQKTTTTTQKQLHPRSDLHTAKPLTPLNMRVSMDTNINSDLYMEEVENKALGSVKGKAPNHYRWMTPGSRLKARSMSLAAH